MDEAGLGIGQREAVILLTNMGHPIVTNGGLFTFGNSQCASERLLHWCAVPGPQRAVSALRTRRILRPAGVSSGQRLQA